MFRNILLLVLATPFLSNAAQAQVCPLNLQNPIIVPKKESDAADTEKRAYRLPDGSILFVGKYTIDADGAPDAFGPNNTGIDNTSSAGTKGNWWALATDAENCGPSGKPLVQGPEHPHPGLYISKTTLINPDVKNCASQQRYVNSRTIPFVALSSQIARIEKSVKGNLVVVLPESGQPQFAVHADAAPVYGIGEGSMALASLLNLNPNPRNGGTNERKFVYLVLPERMGYPASANAVVEAAKTAFAAWGGMEKLKACATAVRAAPR